MKRFGEKRVCLVSGRVRLSLIGIREANDVGGGKMNFCGSECMLFVVLEVLQEKECRKGSVVTAKTQNNMPKRNLLESTGTFVFLHVYVHA